MAERSIKKRVVINAIAATYVTRLRMKNILPMVVNPSKRCGVAARRMPIPAVDNGTVNHAQVKLRSSVRLLLMAAT